jgi:hypothetical protein
MEPITAIMGIPTNVIVVSAIPPRYFGAEVSDIAVPYWVLVATCVANWMVVGGFAEWYRRFPQFRLTKKWPVMSACVISGTIILFVSALMTRLDNGTEGQGIISGILSYPSVIVIDLFARIVGIEDSLSDTLIFNGGIALNWLLLGLIGEWVYRGRKRKQERGDVEAIPSR